jgi:hypothetical protein
MSGNDLGREFEKELVGILEDVNNCFNRISLMFSGYKNSTDEITTSQEYEELLNNLSDNLKLLIGRIGKFEEKNITASGAQIISYDSSVPLKQTLREYNNFYDGENLNFSTIRFKNGLKKQPDSVIKAANDLLIMVKAFGDALEQLEPGAFENVVSVTASSRPSSIDIDFSTTPSTPSSHGENSPHNRNASAPKSFFKTGLQDESSSSLSSEEGMFFSINSFKSGKQEFIDPRIYPKFVSACQIISSYTNADLERLNFNERQVEDIKKIFSSNEDSINIERLDHQIIFNICAAAFKSIESVKDKSPNEIAPVILNALKDLPEFASDSIHHPRRH